MKRRILSMVLTLCLLLSMFPALVPGASAEEPEEEYIVEEPAELEPEESDPVVEPLDGDGTTVIASGYCGGEGDGTNLTWTLTEDGTLTISGEGEMADYRNSSSRLTTAPWAEYKSSMTTLVLENGITTIGSCAFSGCSGFTGNLVIPDSVVSIGYWAFYNCNCFDDDLVIPKTVTSIGFDFIDGCSGIRKIEVSSLNTVYASKDGVLYDKEFAEIIRAPEGISGDLEIPDSVTSIESGFVDGCSGISRIEVSSLNTAYASKDGVLYDKEFVEVIRAPEGISGDLEIPDSVTSIEYDFIDGCTGISRIEVSSLNTAYSSKDGVLYDVEFSKAIRAPEGISGNLEIPDSVTEIYSSAFYDCRGFTGDLVIPDGVTRIGQCAFYGCSGFNGNLVIPNSVTYISDWAFQNCSGLTGNLVIPDSVAFAGEIGTFCGCSGFTGDLVIPEGMYWIASEMFQGCTSLSGNVYFKGNAPGVSGASEDDSSFPSDFTLYYIPGTTGWTDSEYYDADAGTWNGYKLETWDGTGKANVIASGYCGGEGDGTNLTWTLTDDGTLTIGGTGTMKNYSKAPWTEYKSTMTRLVLEAGVTSIGNHAFSGCNGFTGDLVIPDGVTKIGSNAFNGCSGFVGNLIIPDGVTAIGYQAFYNCSGFTGDLVIPDSVTSVDFNAFYNCKGFTGDLVIGDSVTSIGTSAFYNCKGFTGGLEIGNSVISIGKNAFYNCSGFTGKLIIPDSVTSIGESAFHGCSGFNGNLKIGNSVSSIESYAFEMCRSFIGDLVIPDNVTSIGDYAFYYCCGFNGKLEMGNSVTSIGDCAFSYCSGLTGDLVIPASVTSIGVSFIWRCKGISGIEVNPSNTVYASKTGVMYDVGYTEVIQAPEGILGNLVIPDGVTKIRSNAFSCCSGLTGNLIIPNSVTNIGDGAFYGCSGFTGDLVIPDSVTSIENDAFYNCSGFDGNLIIPDGITNIGDSAFFDCSRLTGSLDIPGSVSSIGDWAFYGCIGFIGDLTIPESVTSIGNYAFLSCSGFTGDLVIPDKVTNIGQYAFGGCNGLSGSVYFEGNAPIVISASSSEPSFPTTATLYYIPGTTGWTDSEYYDADAGTWNGYKLETWDGTGKATVIASGYCGGEGDGTNLTWTLTDDGTLTISGTGAMADFGYEYDYENDEWIFTAPWTSYVDSLKTLVIESGVTTIGNNAFKDCSGFTGDLVIPDGVTTIGDSAFSNCSGFTGDLLIHDSVTYIGKNAFTRCEGFDGKLTISTSVTSIEYATFSECGFTGELVIPDGVTRIDGFAFSCLNSGFTGELAIPSSVTSIGEYAFQNCSGFTGELVIPSSVTNIGDSAFHSCSGFTGTLVIPSTVTEIGSSPFSGTSGITWIEVESANPNYASKEGILYDKGFATAIQAPGGLSGELNIPDSVTAIGKSAFYFCKNLTGDLVIPNGVTSIGDGAFNNCSGFTGSLVIPDGVTNIASLAFGYCSGFSGDLVIPSGVSSIGILAFDGCTGLSGDVYFEGDAPTVTAASEGFHSFPTDFTLYYTPGTTGWTDSEYYDADAGTWNGYKLEVWDTSEIDEDAPRLVVQPVTGRPGDTVEVKINVENNPGLVGIATVVTFDTTVLEYVSCEISSEFSGVNNSHINGNTLKTIWVTGDDAVTVNDTFLTITFKINEDAEDGDTYVTLDYDYDNTLDANEECIELATFGDYVTVFSGVLGDVNNSGTVTSLDARWILQYLSGAREFTEEQLALADVNGDGNITAVDARWILQYLSGARDENYQAK